MTALTVTFICTSRPLRPYPDLTSLGRRSTPSQRCSQTAMSPPSSATRQLSVYQNLRAVALLLEPAKLVGLIPTSWNPLDAVKNTVLLYLLLTRLLKIQRHLRARGILQTGHDFYRWTLQVSSPSLNGL